MPIQVETGIHRGNQEQRQRECHEHFKQGEAAVPVRTGTPRLNSAGLAATAALHSGKGSDSHLLPPEVLDEDELPVVLPAAVVLPFAAASCCLA